MGVKGLTSYVKEVGKIRKWNNQHHDQSKDEKNVIIVDSTALSFWLCEDLCFIDTLLATYDVLKEKIVQLVEAFRSVGFDIHFYFDKKSIVDMTGEKAQTLIERKNSIISTALELSTLPRGVFPTCEIKPIFGSWFVISTLEELNCTVKTCLGEADPYIAQEVLTGNNIYGIISSDSDFMLLKGTKFIPFSSINISHNIVDDTSYFEIDVMEYSTEDIADFCKVPSSMLYLVSSFCGNDFTKHELHSKPKIYSKLLKIKEKHPSFSVILSSIVSILSDEDKLNNILQNIQQRYPKLHSGLEYTKNFYTNPYIHIISETNLQEQSLKLKELSTISDVYFEKITSEKPTINDLVEHLECTSYFLQTPKSVKVSQEKGNKHVLKIYRRIGFECKSKEILFTTHLKPKFNEFKTWKNNCTIEKLAIMFKTILLKFSCVDKRQCTFSRFAMTHSFPHALKAIALLNMVASSNHWKDPISSNKFITLLIYCICVGSNFIPDEFNNVSISKSKHPYPSIDTIGLHSFYTATISNLHSIIRAINYPDSIGSPTMYTNGNLFNYIVESIDLKPIRLDQFRSGEKKRKSVSNAVVSCIKQLFPSTINKIPSNTFDLCMQYLKIITTPFGTERMPLIQETTKANNSIGKIDTYNIKLPTIVNSVPIIDDSILPITAHKATIIKHIRNNRITAIRGETGCGKSSQVPQYALEEILTRNSDIKPLIIVTQPRRMAAISLAKRVANEFNCEIGTEVGYRIGQEFSCSKRTKMVFVTNGWLLEKLIHTPAFFSNCSHIILDEIHERSLDSDILTLLVREFISTKMFPNTKVILMSATFDLKLYIDYFSKSIEPSENIPQVYVGVSRFPVDIIYLDNFTNYTPFKKELKSFTQPIQSILQKSTKSYPDIHSYVHQATAFLVDLLAVYHSQDPTGNCILIFFPGLTAIDAFYDSLYMRYACIEGVEQDERTHFVSSKIEIFILHSLIEKDEQMSVFEPVKEGITRVILSTNIAESSLTIPNVKYVIDFGLIRQAETDMNSNMLCLKTSWISKASALQRSGRCGRLFPGTTFRMYSEKLYSYMLEYETPEILRLSLSKTILRLKTLSERVEVGSPFHDVRVFLYNAPQPPKDVRVVHAVDDLIERSAITIEEESESIKLVLHNILLKQNKTLTAEELLSTLQKHKLHFDILSLSRITRFGEFISNIPFDLRLGKLVALGAKCGKYILHTLLIAIGLSHKELFILPKLTSIETSSSYITYIRKAIKARKRYAGSFSDALSIIPLYIDIFMGKNIDGIHFTRGSNFLTTTREIIYNITPLLPNSKHWLDTLIDPRTSEYQLNQALSFTEKDIQFLQLLLAITFKDEQLMKVKITKNEKYIKELEKTLPKSINSKYIAMKSTEFTNIVPNQYCNSTLFATLFPSISTKSHLLSTPQSIFLVSNEIDHHGKLSLLPNDVIVVNTLQKDGRIIIPSPNDPTASVMATVKKPYSTNWSAITNPRNARYKKLNIVNAETSILNHIVNTVDNSKTEYLAIPGNSLQTKVYSISNTSIITNSALSIIIALLVYETKPTLLQVPDYGKVITNIENFQFDPILESILQDKEWLSMKELVNDFGNCKDLESSTWDCNTLHSLITKIENLQMEYKNFIIQQKLKKQFSLLDNTEKEESKDTLIDNVKETTVDEIEEPIHLEANIESDVIEIVTSEEVIVESEIIDDIKEIDQENPEESIIEEFIELSVNEKIIYEVQLE